MRTFWAAASLAIGTALAAGPGASLAAPVPPDQVVKETTAKLQAEISKREQEFRANPRKLYAYVDQVIVPKFDQRYIAQMILARHWKTASDAQRKRFEAAFKSMLVNSYADALVEYHNDVQAEFLPLRMAPEATEVTVQSRLVRNGGKPPVGIGFKMKLREGEWRVVDIVIENLSLITSFRSQINSEIKRSSLDAVIEKLEAGQTIAPAQQPKAG
jgi:phospholipid transport system substrate-binding protein